MNLLQRERIEHSDSLRRRLCGRSGTVRTKFFSLRTIFFWPASERRFNTPRDPHAGRLVSSASSMVDARTRADKRFRLSGRGPRAIALAAGCIAFQRDAKRYVNQWVIAADPIADRIVRTHAKYLPSIRAMIRRCARSVRRQLIGAAFFACSLEVRKPSVACRNELSRAVWKVFARRDSAPFAVVYAVRLLHD